MYHLFLVLTSPVHKAFREKTQLPWDTGRLNTTKRVAIGKSPRKNGSSVSFASLIFSSVRVFHRKNYLFSSLI